MLENIFEAFEHLLGSILGNILEAFSGPFGHILEGRDALERKCLIKGGGEHSLPLVFANLKKKKKILGPEKRS